MSEDEIVDDINTRATLQKWTRGDWMQTYTGKRFYPLDPRPEDIDPEDIAHALSLLCRYGGHVDRFYSVAEHCLLMAMAVDPQYELAALLHDATEAYVGDVVRPLKRLLPEYQRIEEKVWQAIVKRFELKLDEHTVMAVKQADNRILLNERDTLMSRAERDWGEILGLEPLSVTVQGWGSHNAERFYLDRLEELTQ